MSLNLRISLNLFIRLIVYLINLKTKLSEMFCAISAAKEQNLQQQKLR